MTHTKEQMTDELTSVQIQEAIDDAKTLQRQLKESHTVLYDLMAKNVKKLREELENAERPYRESIKHTEERELAASKREYALYSELAAAQRREAIAKAQANGKHDPESARSFCTQHGIRTAIVGKADKYNRDSFELLTTLKNGITVFRSNEDDGGMRKLFAFEGMRFVAYFEKRNSTHPGDNTEGRGWIGVPVFTYDNHLEALEELRVEQLIPGEEWKTRAERHAINAFARKTPRGRTRIDVTATQFLAELEKVTPAHVLPTIDAEASKEVLRNDSRR